MKKRILAILIVLSLLCQPLSAFAANTAASGGDGGFLQPYVSLQAADVNVIDSAAAFMAIRSDPDSVYILMKDIDLGEWTADFGFGGVLMGNGHTITYRSTGRMNRGDSYAAGLFTELDNGAYIENLRVHAQIDDAYEGICDKPVYIGAIAGQAGDGVYLNNCVADVHITVSTVNWLDSARENFEAVAAVDAAALGTGSAKTAIGGMIGYIAPDTDANLYACRSLGTINGADCTGGLVGLCMGSVGILGCENQAAVTGISCVGGLLGSASGECSILQSANRGPVTALQAYAGGLAGSVTCSANDSICDSVNIGSVLCGAAGGMGEYAGGLAGYADCAIVRCVSKAEVIGASPLPYAGNGGNVWEGLSYSFHADDTYDTVLAGGLKSLNMTMVWKERHELGVPYPRLLCGEQVNQFRVAYVESMQEMLRLHTNDTHERDLYSYIMVQNPASVFGENYRKTATNELNTAWSAVLSLSKLLDYDLTALDELAKYDALLCDLMLSEYIGNGSQHTAQATFHDIFMESCADCSNFAQNGINFATAALRISTTVNYISYSKNLASAENYAAKLPDLSKIFQKQADHAEKWASGFKDVENGFTDVTGVLGIFLNYFTVYESADSEADLLNAAYDIYNSSFSHMDDILFDVYWEAQSGEWLYPDQKDADLNLSLLADAIDDFRENAYEKNEHPMLSEIGDELGAHIFGLLGGGGAYAEALYLDKLADTIGAEWLSEAGLYKIAVAWGRGLNTLIGNEDFAYNGNLLNCAGYMADMLLPTVQDAYKDFLRTPDYEKAVCLHDALTLYFSLQLLSFDYAEKMISGGWYKSSIPQEHKAMDELQYYKVDIHAFLVELDFMGGEPQ